MQLAGAGRRRRAAGAGIGHLLVEARRRAEQFADARRAEALGPGAAEQQVLDRLPVDPGAERRRGEGAARIGRNSRNSAPRRSARGGGRRRVAKQRQAQLGIGLVDVVAARGGQGRDVRAEAGGDDRSGSKRPVWSRWATPMAIPTGPPGSSNRSPVRLAEKSQIRWLRAVALGEGDIIEHRLGDRARPAEDVERHARRRCSPRPGRARARDWRR